MTAWPWPAPADDGAAKHLSPGQRLPDAALGTARGQPINLAGLRGLAVVFVYTWTGRPGLANPPGWDTIPGAHGSTPEAEGFRNLHQEFTDIGAQIIGLSAQKSDHQREFADRLGLAFPIVSDSEFRFADALGLPRFTAGTEVYLRRLTLVVRDGAIIKVFYPVHPPDSHAGEVLTWLREFCKTNQQRS